MRSLKLYATASATANAAATVTIPSASVIRGIQWAAGVISITAGSGFSLEVSTQSARQIATLGAQFCISEVRIVKNFVTSGMDFPCVNMFAPCAVSVVQGQIIYLHALLVGTATYDATALVWYD